MSSKYANTPHVTNKKVINFDTKKQKIPLTEHNKKSNSLFYKFMLYNQIVSFFGQFINNENLDETAEKYCNINMLNVTTPRIRYIKYISCNF